MNEDYVLMVYTDPGHSQVNLQFSIVALNEEEEKAKQGWRRFCGFPCMIPSDVMKNIMSLEQTIGKAIIRPSMHGNTKVMLGPKK